MFISLLITVSTVLAGASLMGITAAQGADVTISNVTVSPDDPAPGEPFVVTTYISNLKSSSDGDPTTDNTITITDVYIRPQGSTTEYARVENPGSLSPGSTMAVPLSVTIGQPGMKNLRVTVIYLTASGVYEKLEYPLLVTVEEPNEVLLAITATGATVNEETSVEVVVANGDSNPISSVELVLEGDGTLENPRRISASIKPGVDKLFLYNVTFQETGPRTLEATVTYTTSEGATRTVTERVMVNVGTGSENTGETIIGEIRLTGVDTSGRSIITIQGDAANVGGTNVKSVLLEVKDTKMVSPYASSGETFVGAVNASTFDTFELIARVEDGATAIPIRITYIVDGERVTKLAQINLSANGGASLPDFGQERGSIGMRTPLGSQQSGSFGLVLVVPLVAVIGLSGLGFFLWKRR